MPKERLDYGERRFVSSPDHERLSWSTAGNAQLDGYRCKACRQVILSYGAGQL